MGKSGSLRQDEAILVVNAGSSSLKLGLYVAEGEDERLLFDGQADGIGQEKGTFELRDADGRVVRTEELHLAKQEDALRRGFAWLSEAHEGQPVAIGHRVVHGGPRLVEHQRVTDEVLKELKACVHFAPLHIPTAIALIEEAERAYPKVAQFACFDTAFHRTLPEASARYALPQELFDAGVRRYGFHGLSYESIVYQLGAKLPSKAVLAHLGSGASLTAVRGGRSVDTSMGLTPTGGIPMATRCGDMDPGVLLHVMRTKGMDADAIETMVNHDAGMKALAGTSDMRKVVEAAAGGDAKAALAVEIFCAAVAKTIAAYAAVLGGVEMVVFAGGIGEHAAEIRGNVCARLGFLGLRLDEAKNDTHSVTISASDSTVAVCIVRSEENLQIARHSRGLLGQG